MKSLTIKLFLNQHIQYIYKTWNWREKNLVKLKCKYVLLDAK